MSAKSQQELYDIFITELQNQAAELTDTSDGSIIDVVGGATSVAVREAVQLLTDEFKKTFFDTADGPEVTGGPDDLQALAVDHFGPDFARPGATKAIGIVMFSRPNADAGDCIIPVGTLVKTLVNSNGVAQRFEVVAEVTLVATTISAAVRALLAGTDGNVLANKIVAVESSLTDPTVTVNNSAACSGGAAIETDVEYRETIRNLIATLRGSTLAAIRAKALTVAGVATATATELVKTVIEWNPATEMPIGQYFKIPYPKLYVADPNGAANGALLQSVRDAIDLVRSAGVWVEVIAAIAESLDWTVSITLNPGGPNFGTLTTDTALITDAMRAYIQGLPIGSGFVRSTAEAAIMAIFGPAGTDDLTALTTDVPSGDVAAVATHKLIPGTMST